MAPLPRVGALDLVAAQQADRLALDGGLATPEADAASLRSAVTAAGWAAPPDLGVARAYAVRRTLDQAADWFVHADNPDGPSLFDDRATAAGAGAARLRDGRTAWVLVVAAGARPPIAAASPSSAASSAAATLASSASATPAAFAVTALPPAGGEAFGPALPDVGAAPGGGAIDGWTPTLQNTARIVVALVIGLFAARALGLRGPDRG